MKTKMSDKIALFTIIACLLMIPDSRAETGSAGGQTPPDKPGWTQLRLKPDAKWKIIGHSLGLPAYFFLHVNIHEGSHVLAAACAGAEVTEFRPYPHMIGSNFVFGSMAADGPLSERQQAWMLAAPYMSDMAIFTAADLTLEHFVSSDSAAAPFLLTGGMIAPLVDFLWGVNGPSDHNDTTRLGKIIGMPKWSIMLIGDAMAALAVWRILHHGREILMTGPEGINPRKVHTGSVALVPFVGGGGFGLGLRATY